MVCASSNVHTYLFVFCHSELNITCWFSSNKLQLAYIDQVYVLIEFFKISSTFFNSVCIIDPV